MLEICRVTRKQQIAGRNQGTYLQSYNKHFTCAVFVQGKWTYIDDLCTSVKEFTSLAATVQARVVFFTI